MPASSCAFAEARELCRPPPSRPALAMGKVSLKQARADLLQLPKLENRPWAFLVQ